MNEKYIAKSSKLIYTLICEIRNKGKLTGYKLQSDFCGLKFIVSIEDFKEKFGKIN